MSITTTAVQPLIYVILGCPGSGKGTFAQAISPEGYDHVSTGDITRKEVQNETEFGLKYKEAILGHVIGGIPFEEIQRLVDQRLEKAILGQKGVILDGYPKTKEQCELLDTFIQSNGLQDKVVVVLLDVKEENAIDRILYRQTCGKCGKIYNSKFSPSKTPDECDACDGALTKRMDDDAQGIKKRVYEFKTKMQPVIEYYACSGRLHEIDGNAAPEVCLEKFANFHRTMQSKA
ncbi:MAG: nucleoside monophosphate kinase [Verrucomicrobia bacterium]|nr:nucleoside monophosphate kinase [Verrucomicrobiota bacterium]